MAQLSDAVVSQTERQELESLSDTLGTQIAKVSLQARQLEEALLGADAAKALAVPDRPLHFVGWMRRALDEARGDVIEISEVLARLVAAFEKR